MLMRTHSSFPDLQLLPHLIFFFSLPTSIICKNFKPSEFQGSNEHITAHLPAVSHLLVRCSEPQFHSFRSSINALPETSAEWSYLLVILLIFYSLLQVDFYPQILCCNFHSDIRRDSRFATLNQNFLNHHLYQWHPDLNPKAFSWVPDPYVKIFFWTFLFGHLPG